MYVKQRDYLENDWMNEWIILKLTIYILILNSMCFISHYASFTFHDAFYRLICNMFYIVYGDHH